MSSEARDRVGEAIFGDSWKFRVPGSTADQRVDEVMEAFDEPVVQENIFATEKDDYQAFDRVTWHGASGFMINHVFSEDVVRIVTPDGYEFTAWTKDLGEEDIDEW